MYARLNLDFILEAEQVTKGFKSGEWLYRHVLEKLLSGNVED